MILNIELTVDVPEETDLEKAIDKVEAAVRAAGFEICAESAADEIEADREPPDPPGWEGGFAENH